VPVGSPPWIMKDRMMRWNCTRGREGRGGERRVCGLEGVGVREFSAHMREFNFFPGVGGEAGLAGQDAIHVRFRSAQWEQQQWQKHSRESSDGSNAGTSTGSSSTVEAVKAAGRHCCRGQCCCPLR